MSESKSDPGRKAGQTKLAQVLTFTIALVVLGVYYAQMTTLAKAGVSTDVLALIAQNFLWIAGMAFSAVAGQLVTFTWGNIREHKYKNQPREGT